MIMQLHVASILCLEKKTVLCFLLKILATSSFPESYDHRQMEVGGWWLKSFLVHMLCQTQSSDLMLISFLSLKM